MADAFDPDVTMEAVALRARAALEPSPIETTFAFVSPAFRFVLGGSGPARAVFGTSPAADVVLSGRQASRRHAAFELAGAGVAVSDLGSKNGTWVNGVRVREAELAGGEQITIGDHTFVLERGPNAPVPLANDVRFGAVLGNSRRMRRLFPLFERLAATNVSVLVQGDAGTGKETLAESIHSQGPRREREFIVFDCAATTPATFEDDLARALERAQASTLFFDEPAELPAAVQAKLLRAIERGAAQDVRLVSGTRRDLDREIGAGRFREDLLLRLAVARVDLPPLKKRTEDIPLLAAHFAAELGARPEAISAAKLEAWAEQPWPNNVRELQNQVAREITVGDIGGEIDKTETNALPAANAPDWLAEILAKNLLLVEARDQVNAVFERRYVEHMLAETGNNVVRAAARAGVARRYFQIMKAKRLP